jgi:beta-galactosidase
MFYRKVFLKIYIALIFVFIVSRAFGSEIQKLDFDWRFHLGAAEGAEQTGFDDSGWRKIDLPHDWSIEDLDAEKLKKEVYLRLDDMGWRFQKGDDPAWKQPGFDDSGWEKVTPDIWEKHSNYQENPAFGWYRRTVVIEKSIAGRNLKIAVGWVDDADETYFDGVLIGKTGKMPPEPISNKKLMRIYPIPVELATTGEHVIAVRVYDMGGDGGLVETPLERQISGPFDSWSEGGKSEAYTRGGVGWYRKHFTVPAEWKDKRVLVQFDGVYMDADVWLNGKHLGQHSYGYTSFALDLTDHLKTENNVLAVEVKNIQPSSRWYAGSGIYRHVWLKAFAPIHIANWGTAVVTPKVSLDMAEVRVRTTIENTTGKRQEVVLETVIVGPDGKKSEQMQSVNRISEREPYKYEQVFRIVLPRLWSPDSPSLYKAVSTLKMGDEVLDESQTVFGIRSLEFDVKKGFLLNGKPTVLKGACMHHDNGPLGAAAYDRAEERKVELMKSAGYNAIRCAHNPPSPAFLDACDRLGMLVIDEAFDYWNTFKRMKHGDFPLRWRKDIESMVLMGRNHPSVIMWSIGNEISEQHQDLGAKTARELADHVRSLDTTRPVTAAMCQFGMDTDWLNREPFSAALDVPGYNYRLEDFRSDHKRHPDRVMYMSESMGSQAFEYWSLVEDLEYVIGDFVWTGMDYLGESGVGWAALFDPAIRYPWTLPYCGDLDLCGFRRPASYYRDVLWGNDGVYAFVQNPDPNSIFGMPYKSTWGYPDVHMSWTWPGQEGKGVNVEVYSRCPRVRLLVNGKDLGVKPVSRSTQYKAVWKDVIYEPGTLQAIGYDGVSESAQWTLRTVGKPEAIRLWADRQIIAADGQDLSYVTIEVVDSQGLRIPDAKLPITLELDGAATLIGFGSGNPKTTESFQTPCRNTFEGRCLAIIKASNKPGTITVKAAGSGLNSDSLEIQVK